MAIAGKIFILVQTAKNIWFRGVIVIVQCRGDQAKEPVFKNLAGPIIRRNLNLLFHVIFVLGKR